ncbi:MAG: GNAT family N-acetyltransferase [Acidimicrobiales bacterium]
MARRPADRLAADLVVLERAHVGHLDGLQTAIEMSFLELQPWMDWIGDEPQSRPMTLAHLEERPGQWESGEAFSYTMTDPGTGEVIGNCSLMARRGPGRLEIGYWVRSDRAGAGIATAAAGLLTDAAFAVDGIDHTEIHHDAANHASGRVAEKLGYSVVARHVVEKDDPRQAGVDVVWELSRPARP